jgi:hypothetical protein
MRLCSIDLLWLRIVLTHSKRELSVYAHTKIPIGKIVPPASKEKWARRFEELHPTDAAVRRLLENLQNLTEP